MTAITQAELKYAIETITKASEPWTPQLSPPPEKSGDESTAGLSQSGRLLLRSLETGSVQTTRGIWSPGSRPADWHERGLMASIETLREIATSETDPLSLKTQAVEVLVQRGQYIPFQLAALRIAVTLRDIAQSHPERFTPELVGELIKWRSHFNAANYPWAPTTPFMPRKTYGTYLEAAQGEINQAIKLLEIYTMSPAERNIQFLLEKITSAYSPPELKRALLIDALYLSHQPGIKIDLLQKVLALAKNYFIRLLLDKINRPTIDPETQNSALLEALYLSRQPGVARTLVKEVNHHWIARYGTRLNYELNIPIADSKSAIKFWLAKANDPAATDQDRTRSSEIAAKLSQRPGIHLELVRQVNRTYFAVHGQAPQRVPHRYIQTRMSGVRALERVSRF